jgi:hypothetical protein
MSYSGGSAVPKQTKDTVALQSKASVIQLFCCFQAWYRNGPFDCLWTPDCQAGSLSYDKISKGIQDLAFYLTKFLPREEGNQWNLQKFHDLMRHWIMDKKESGEVNFSADVTEFMHKYFAKMPGSTAVTHGSTKFEASVADRITERQFFNDCEQYFSIAPNPYKKAK